MTVVVPIESQHDCVWEVLARPEEIPRLRREVAAVVDAWGVAQGAEYTVLLGVSELLANVAAHVGDPQCRLELRRVGTAVCVFVHDRSSQPPRLGGPCSLLATEGRGLSMVRAMADALGWTPTEGGKHVWFVCGPSRRHG
jgi:anti-sigma regulatory factor (Ser/Thr protein kinase)